MEFNGRVLAACIIACTSSFSLQAGDSNAGDTLSALDAAWLADIPIAEDKPITDSETPADRLPLPAEPEGGAQEEAPHRKSWLPESDPDAYSIVSVGRGLSFHKPNYLYPATYSPAYRGSSSEVLFGLSLKLRFFSLPLYLGYSQKSFFQAFNGKDSKPFRETDFNPEIFYRFLPKNAKAWHHLGLDAGVEHESNGQSLPGSRSWNRVYIAPFHAQGKSLIYWKWWFRIPEDKNRLATDPKRDDNPDIQDYYGYSELHIEQEVFDKHLINALFRYNPVTGRGAVNLQYSIPGPGKNFFWGLYVWNGYGESLLDYNRSVTRVGLGIQLTR